MQAGLQRRRPATLEALINLAGAGPSAIFAALNNRDCIYRGIESHGSCREAQFLKGALAGGSSVTSIDRSGAYEALLARTLESRIRPGGSWACVTIGPAAHTRPFPGVI
jgi:hypothetical protein